MDKISIISDGGPRDIKILLNDKKLESVVSYEITQDINSLCRVKLELYAELEFKVEIEKVEKVNRFDLLDI